MKLLLSAFLILSLNSFSQNNYQKVVVKDRDKLDFLGFSSSISGDFAIAGACHKSKSIDNKPIWNAGAAYFFKKDKNGVWKEYQKVLTNDSIHDLAFGESVSIFNNHAIVGALGDREDGSMKNRFTRNGAAYIYKLINEKWVAIQKLILIKSEWGDNFGRKVCISDKYVVVSSPGRNRNIKDTAGSYGAVYIYKKDSQGKFSLLHEILPEKPYKEFGKTIALFDDNLIIGADNPSCVLIFKIKKDSKPVLTQELSPDKPMGEAFGNSIAIYSNNILIGITSHSARSAGMTYLYTKNKDNNWTFKQRLYPKDLAEEDNFGYALAISDSIAVIGALGDKMDSSEAKNKSNSGAAYIFRKNKKGEWMEEKKLASLHREPWQKFGFSVGISKKEIVIGSRFESTDKDGNNSVKDAGAVYFYKIP
jgi:hypothetical protein